jgi:hypothetical protein
VRHRDCEPTIGSELFLECGRFPDTKLPGAATAVALKVSVFRIRPHVVFLAPVRTVTVDDEAKVLKGVERPVNG